LPTAYLLKPLIMSILCQQAAPVLVVFWESEICLGLRVWLGTGHHDVEKARMGMIPFDYPGLPITSNPEDAPLISSYLFQLWDLRI
jgi:hypothetical protein